MARSLVRTSGKKELGWAAGGFVLVAIVSGFMGFMQTRSAEDHWSSGDQTLDSLDVLPLADRSGSIPIPGGSKKDSKNADWTNPESMLYQVPGGAQGETTAAESAGDKLSDDIAKSNGMGKKPADASGWGGEAARTGLTAATAARPALAPMTSSLGGSGGGTSGASFSSGSSPFGIGQSHPGEAHINGAPAASAGVVQGGNQSLQALRQVASAMGNARRSNDMERSWGHGSGSFDGAGAAGTLSGGGTTTDGIGTGSGIPANLKGDDNADGLGKKDIQPPPPGTPTPVDNSAIQNRELLMMAAGLVAAGLVAMAVKSLTSNNGSSAQTKATCADGTISCLTSKASTPSSSPH